MGFGIFFNFMIKLGIYNTIKKNISVQFPIKRANKFMLGNLYCPLKLLSPETVLVAIYLKKSKL